MRKSREDPISISSIHPVSLQTPSNFRPQKRLASASRGVCVGGAPCLNSWGLWNRHAVLLSSSHQRLMVTFTSPTGRLTFGVRCKWLVCGDQLVVRNITVPQLPRPWPGPASACHLRSSWGPHESMKSATPTQLPRKLWIGSYRRI